jgi:hypothetical protein
VDPLGGALFTLAHFRILRPITTTHPSCVSPFFANDTHIVGPTSNVVLAFLQLQKDLSTLRLPMLLTKCVAWSFQRLDHFVSLSLSFFIHNSSFRILCAPMGSTSFVVDALHEDLGTIFNLPMLTDLHEVFVMLLLCHAQH